MIEPVFIFLPAIICLFWVVIHCVWSFRTDNFWIILLLIVDLALFLISDSSYLVPGVPLRVLAAVNLVMVLTAPVITPLVWLYLEKLRFGPGRLQHPAHLIWIILPTILFTVSVLLTSMISYQEAEGFYHRLLEGGNGVIEEYRGTIFYTYFVWTVLIFRYVLVFELLCFLVWVIYLFKKDHFRLQNLYDYLFKGKPIRMVELQTYSIFPAVICFVVKITLFKDFTDTHLGLTILINFLLSISFLFYFFPTLFSVNKTICMKQFRHSFLYNYGKKSKSQVVEDIINELVEEAEEVALRRIQNKIGASLSDEELQELPHSLTSTLFTAVSDSWEEDSLMSRFQHLMIDEQLFLQAGLTLQDVADKLNSNKTYISKLVNNTYNLGFPELINILRVDYAEQYIMSHRDAIQSEVAAACGFQSASSFNIIFKKVTGVTPKVWAGTHEN